MNPFYIRHTTVFAPNSAQELKGAIGECVQQQKNQECAKWSDLTPDVQRQIKEKQQAAKDRKQQIKLHKRQQSVFDAANKSKTTANPTNMYPSSITYDAYMSACPGGFFQYPSIAATFGNVDKVLWLERSGVVFAELEDGTELTVTDFNYFMFAGTESPRFYAKLAFEGFMTVTTGGEGGSPTRMLPELQPFYRSVLFCRVRVRVGGWRACMSTRVSGSQC